MDYLKRVLDGQLQEYLEAFGAVNIEGPKWCGKTTTAMQQAASVIELQDTDKREEYLATALTKASLLIEGETPRLIDEWQDAPTLWDAVRVACDRRRKPAQFILTGSSTADTDATAHSGTGRIAGLTMLPMSLYESGESTGTISLEALFDNPDMDLTARSEMDIEDLIFAACRGGWPATLMPKTERAKLLIAKNYVRSVCEKDISRAAKEKLDPKIALAILRSYARNISTLADKTTILADVTANNDTLVRSTFDKYIAVLEKLFVITDITAWNPSIRSKTAIRSGNKRSFCDPSIAAASLGIGPGQLKTQLKTFGFIFENMCTRDLKVYSAPLGGEISHYRDRYGLEADIVLHLEDGRYALIECKLGSFEIEDGATHLKELANLIKKHNEKEAQVPLRNPDILIVITGGEYAYTRPDGVKVIPLACLRQ
ncbi:MAG: DUF4143 domain-containing protein [Bacteroidia bacterium]|nr:DUF4143 domain-containing protein [Bacteroidia bacterium]